MRAHVPCAPVAIVLVIAMAGWAPSGASAQSGSSGSIRGMVMDQTGQPIKGVKVQAKSPTQIGGTLVAYSNDEGSYRFLGLHPGKFEVSGSAPQMKTVIQREVAVSLTVATEVNLIMEVMTQVEDVKVIEKAPIVSTTSASVKEVYDTEFIDELPLDTRGSVESFVAESAAGAAEIGGTRPFRMRGGAVDQTKLLVEGFFMNEQQQALTSLASLEVQTAGHGVETPGAPAGVVNMVTKSGSNKFEFDMSGHMENSNFRFFDAARGATTQSEGYVLNPNFSGPIIMDRLWYYVTLEGSASKSVASYDPSGTVPQYNPLINRSLRGSAKLSWQLTPRNKLISYTHMSREDSHNRKQSYGDYYEAEAQERRQGFDYFTGLIWESLLSDKIFFKAQAGVRQDWSEIGPQRCSGEPIDCDHIPQTVQSFPRTLKLFNVDNHQQIVRYVWQGITTLEWFPSSRAFGEHQIKLKSDYIWEIQEVVNSQPGNVRYYNVGDRPDRRIEYFSNDPRLEAPRHGWFMRGSTAWKNTSSLSDSMRITRYLTFNPGVALTVTGGENLLGHSPITAMVLTPHLAFAWDATHDGRTALRGSFNNYLELDHLGLIQHTLGGQVSRECGWNDLTQDYDRNCRYSGGPSSATVGLPCGPSGVNVDGTSCYEKMKIPRTWEYTFGIEREIIPGVALGSDLVYRLFTYPWDRSETNRIWNGSGTTLDTLSGYRNGRAEDISNLSTPSSLRKRYAGVTTSLHKRQGTMKASVHYTWSQLQGNHNSDGANNKFGDIPARDALLWGDNMDDHRHNIRGTVTYRWSRWFKTGFVYEYLSGAPYNRWYWNDGRNGFDDPKARVGHNPGSDINDASDDRPTRLPDRQKFNLQASFNLLPLTGVDFEGFVDVLNVLALDTPTAVEQNNNVNWGLPTAFTSPFRVRLGFRYRY